MKKEEIKSIKVGNVGIGDDTDVDVLRDNEILTIELKE